MAGARLPAFTTVKVFSTTLAADRNAMGENIGRWLDGHHHLQVVDMDIRQSSDSGYHCLSIVLFLREQAAGTAVA